MAQRKVHFLHQGTVGLYEHFMTYCGAAGDYAHDAKIRHYLTGALYLYTNDWSKVTCKSCKIENERQ